MGKPTPEVRRDGRCVVCRGQRTVPKPLQKGVPAFVYERDPFCSAVCARRYYGNDTPAASIWSANPEARKGEAA